MTTSSSQAAVQRVASVNNDANVNNSVSDPTNTGPAKPNNLKSGKSTAKNNSNGSIPVPPPPPPPSTPHKKPIKRKQHSRDKIGNGNADDITADAEFMLPPTSMPFSTSASAQRESGLPMDLVWTFGFNPYSTVLNLSDDERTRIMYVAGVTAVLYDADTNEQILLEGHHNGITCIAKNASSEWLATADYGRRHTVVVWSAADAQPVRLLVQPCAMDSGVTDAGVVDMAFTCNTQYLVLLTCVNDEKVARQFSLNTENSNNNNNGGAAVANENSTQDADEPAPVLYAAQHVSFWDWSLSESETRPVFESDVGLPMQSRLAVHPDIVNVWATWNDTGFVAYRWDSTTGEVECDIPDMPAVVTVHGARMNDITFMSGRPSDDMCILIAASDGDILVYSPKSSLDGKRMDFKFRYSHSIGVPRGSAATSAPAAAAAGAHEPTNSGHEQHSLTYIKSVQTYFAVGDNLGSVHVFDSTFSLVYTCSRLGYGPVASFSFTTASLAAIRERISMMRRSPQAVAASAMAVDSASLFKPAHTDFLPTMTVSTTEGAVLYVRPLPFGKYDLRVLKNDFQRRVQALVVYPILPYLLISDFAGSLKIWDYERKVLLHERKFPADSNKFTALAIDPSESFVAAGTSTGVVRLLNSADLALESRSEYGDDIFHGNGIDFLSFSHDVEYLAAADRAFCITLFRRNKDAAQSTTNHAQLYSFHAKAQTHCRRIKGLMWLCDPASLKPRLFSCGEDRTLLEYDVEQSGANNSNDLLVSNRYEIEQSALPTGMMFYPPVNTSENFLLTANTQFKLKLYNVETGMCRRTVLGPLYGSDIMGLVPIDTGRKTSSLNGDEPHLIGFYTHDMVGVAQLPLDGNPFRYMCRRAHPAGGVATVIAAPPPQPQQQQQTTNQTSESPAVAAPSSAANTSRRTQYLFSVGGSECCVHMWRLNRGIIDVMAKRGGGNADLDGTSAQASLEPFYAVLPGGRWGQFYKQCEDFFYYCQLKSQGFETYDARHTSDEMPVSELPFYMRALGYFPSERDIQDMINEVKYHHYAETGHLRYTVDIKYAIMLFVNYRPAFGLRVRDIDRCLDILFGSIHSQQNDDDVADENGSGDGLNTVVTSHTPAVVAEGSERRQQLLRFRGEDELDMASDFVGALSANGTPRHQPLVAPSSGITPIVTDTDEQQNSKEASNRNFDVRQFIVKTYATENNAEEKEQTNEALTVEDEKSDTEAAVADDENHQNLQNRRDFDKEVVPLPLLVQYLEHHGEHFSEQELIEALSVLTGCRRPAHLIDPHSKYRKTVDDWRSRLQLPESFTVREFMEDLLGIETAETLETVGSRHDQKPNEAAVVLAKAKEVVEQQPKHVVTERTLHDDMERRLMLRETIINMMAKDRASNDQQQSDLPQPPLLTATKTSKFGKPTGSGEAAAQYSGGMLGSAAPNSDGGGMKQQIMKKVGFSHQNQ